MNSPLDHELYDEADELGYVPHLKNMPRARKNGPAGSKGSKPARPAAPPEPILDLAGQQDDQFEISYQASRHEAIWLEASLREFVVHRWVDDVLRMIKGGKEASVYLCRGNSTSGMDYLAAKVYRPRRFRNLKNDFLYREGRANLDESGRVIHNSGMLHAMHKKTDYGRELLHTSWLEHEYKTLEVLHQAGADVPKPFAADSNAILMQYFGDDVMGAPTLNDVNLTSAEARGLFERVLHNIDLMLAHGRIHGDLSAFNILYWEGDIVIIDFPQAVRPNENRSALHIFERDVTRICEYFQRQGVRSNPRQLAADLWTRHQFAPMLPIDPKVIGEEDGRDIWESLKNS